MADDYVKRSDVHKAFQPKYAPAINRTFAAMIDNVPAADVVEVVRCQECMYYHEYTCDRWADGTFMEPTDYCSRAAKKDGGQDE